MRNSVTWNEITHTYDNGRTLEEVYDDLHAGTRYGDDSTCHARGSERLVENLGFTRVLDLGCGRSKWLHRLQGVPERVAVDISQSALDDQERDDDGIQTYKADLSTSLLPWPDNWFDVVGSFDFLEHLPPGSVDQALEEISRLASRRVILSIASFRHDLAGGEELHLTVKEPIWWSQKIEQHIGPWARWGRGRGGPFWVIDKKSS